LCEDFDGLTEGVSLLELVEAAVSVLHQLAREPLVAECIYLNKPLMHILITVDRKKIDCFQEFSINNLDRSF
jgi:hypothetical protein